MKQLGVGCKGEHLVIRKETTESLPEAVCGPRLEKKWSSVGIWCKEAMCPVRLGQDPKDLTAATAEVLSRYNHTGRYAPRPFDQYASSSAFTAAEHGVIAVEDGVFVLLPGDEGYPQNPEELPIEG